MRFPISLINYHRRAFPVSRRIFSLGILSFCLSLALLVGCGSNLNSGGLRSGSQTPVHNKSHGQNDSIDSTVKIEISINPGESSDAVFELTGLPRDQLQLLNQQIREQQDRPKVFQIYTGKDIAADQPSMLGAYSVAESVLRFTPRFPLQPGQAYTALYRPQNFTANELGAEGDGKISKVFSIPKPPESRSTIVEQVYPSQGILPQNLLKFYLHFSAPMQQGDSYAHIQLLDAEGKPVDDPFLELGEELWDESGTRLTLLFDPGRIKKELQPREEVGPPLHPGKRYTLLVDAQWLDAQRNRLKAEFRKDFEVIAPDETQPRIAAWRVDAPQADSATALQIHLDESLDHAMLQRVLFVTDSSQSEVPGRVEVAAEETIWRFLPDEPWQAGEYKVIVETTLEDLAGNSLGRPFETDLKVTRNTSPLPATAVVPFEVSSESDE